MAYKEDDEIVTTFILETRDHLEDIEQGILSLENNMARVDQNLVHKIFRAAHSIKAGANLLEFRNIEAVAHELEEILQKVRLGQYKLTGDDVSLLLSGIDKLNEMIGNIYCCDQISVDPLIKRLNAMTR